MDERRPISPRERIEERRAERETWRSYLKHCEYFLNVLRWWAALAECASERRMAGLIEYARKKLGSRSSFVKFPKPPPCFLKGLPGFARTDTAPAPAFN